MKKRITTVFLTICLVLGLTQVAPALVTPPTVTLTVGTETEDFDMIPTPTGFLLPARVKNVAGVGWLSVQITTDITATDPLVSWALSATNLGASALDFSFSVDIPVFLPTGPTLVVACAAGGLTDVTGDGISVTPTNSSGFLQDNTLDPPNFTWSVGDKVEYPGGTPSCHTYGSFRNGPADGPEAGGAAILSDVVSFTLSPFNDKASLSGFCAIVPAPIPASSFLFTFGLFSLLGLGRRMKN